MITAPTEGRALPLLTPRWIAIGGIALGVFAFWLSIPPISTRAPWWPVLIGLCAIAAGVSPVSPPSNAALSSTAGRLSPTPARS